MDEEIDTRKINNSFLRDHNYATEGISHHMIAFSQVHIESDLLKELFGNSSKGSWFGFNKAILYASFRIKKKKKRIIIIMWNHF